MILNTQSETLNTNLELELTTTVEPLSTGEVCIDVWLTHGISVTFNDYELDTIIHALKQAKKSVSKLNKANAKAFKAKMGY
jgi:hypothetical protein